MGHNVYDKIVAH